MKGLRSRWLLRSDLPCEVRTREGCSGKGCTTQVWAGESRIAQVCPVRSRTGEVPTGQICAENTTACAFLHIFEFLQVDSYYTLGYSSF